MPTCTASTRNPQKTPLYQLLQNHLATFLRDADARDDRSLPPFVRKALSAHLRCGILAHGFARYRCPACKHEHLSAHSCKGRGLCPSCDGRRMTQLAAHLVDKVFPEVPTRQWVLTFPHELRYRLAYDRELLNAVHRIVSTALKTNYRHRAKGHATVARDANIQTGFVTFIQRFGSSLNLNLHFHIHACDGVFEESQAGDLRFVKALPPTKNETQRLTETIRKRVIHLLRTRGILQDDAAPDPLHERSPQLAACYSAAIRHTSALTHPGRRLLRLGHTRRRTDPFVRKGAHGHAEGFDLHANLTVPAHDRAQLERLLRYVNRPPLSNARLKQLDDGRYSLKLKTRWHDGTSHLILHPHEVIERLAALIPKPRKNLIHYGGVLAPNHKWRKRVVALPFDHDRNPSPEPNHAWADLMRRSFGKD
ncbi:MAG: transposase, partial [Myxococcales bacterium]|nr:transposase [Myxococcales bacterium]